MPKSKSQVKSARQDVAKRNRNRIQKSKIKSVMKRALKASTDEEKTKIVNEGYKIIDKAASKNVIKKNKAANKKSQLAKLVKKA
ncbi:MAG: 30S ribosomal protein S20 [bacterium]|nr:30S ribosomal protein S20 [bacterium]